MQEYEFGQLIDDLLKKIGGELNLEFEEYSPNMAIKGDYNSQNWTYQIHQSRIIDICHWVRPFPVVRQISTDIIEDKDKQKLEDELREAVKLLVK